MKSNHADGSASDLAENLDSGGAIKSNQGFEGASQILPKEMKLANTQEELEKIRQFKETYCSSDRSGVSDFHHDGYDDLSYVVYGEDEQGSVISTSRLLMDSEKGFPEEIRFPQAIADMRRAGIKLAELGRLLIVENNVTQFRCHYKSVFLLARLKQIDTVLIMMKRKHVSSHHKMMSVEVLANNMGFSWDEEQAELSLVAWDINASQPKFCKWVGLTDEKYSTKTWNEYSQAHLGVMVSVQREVYKDLSDKAYGNVSEAEANVTQDAKQNFGIHHGLSLPVLSGSFAVSGISVVSMSNDIEKFEKLKSQSMAQLEEAASNYHTKIIMSREDMRFFIEPLLGRLNDTKKKVLKHLLSNQPMKTIPETSDISQKYAEKVILKMRKEFGNISTNELLYILGMVHIHEYL